MGDRRYLEQRHKTWFARVAIAPSLRAAFGGKQKLIRSLGTHSLSDAQTKRHAVVAELKKLISAKSKRKGVHEVLGPDDIADAVHLGKRMLSARNAGKDAKAAQIDNQLMDRVTALHESSEPWAGLALLEFSEGLPPIGSKLEAWLAETFFTDRTKADHRSAVKKLGAWLIANKIPPSFDLVTNERASLFIEEALVAKRVHYKTANKLLSGLRTYWKWMKRRGYVEFNPWDGKSLQKQRVPRSEQERAFSDEEVIKLFAGGPTLLIRDLMAISPRTAWRHLMKALHVPNTCCCPRSPSSNSGIWIPMAELS